MECAYYFASLNGIGVKRRDLRDTTLARWPKSALHPWLPFPNAFVFIQNISSQPASGS